MTDTPITLVGNIVTDPEVRHTPAGAAVTNFRIASTPRTYSKTTNQWEDGETLFLTVNVWRDQAQNIADSLTKGTRVIVTGKLKSRSYVTRDGDQRTVFEVEADEVGPSLKFATAQVTKSGGGGGGQAAVSSGSWGQQSQQQPVAAGAWGSQDSGAPF